MKCERVRATARRPRVDYVDGDVAVLKRACDGGLGNKYHQCGGTDVGGRPVRGAIPLNNGTVHKTRSGHGHVKGGLVNVYGTRADVRDMGRRVINDKRQGV